MKELTLNRLLSTVEVVAMNVKGRHWIVAGAEFDSAHTLLDEAWKTLLDGADKVAETIRVLDGQPEWDAEQWAKLTYVGPDKTITTSSRRYNVDDFVRATRDELNKIVALVHDCIESKVIDYTLESDLTAFTSKLRCHILFLDGFLVNWDYAE